MLGGFRKSGKRGNIRKKVETEASGEDEDIEIESETLPPPVVVPEIIKPIKKSQSKTALSFGDELDQGDEFVLKKSKASLSMKEQTKREKRIKKKKEKQKELTGDTEDVVSSALTSSNGVIIKTFKEEELADEYEINSVQTDHKFSLRQQNFTKSDQAIPDAATIYAMKKQREQARQFGGQSYVPLNSNKYEGRFAAGKSRLVREEMEDGSSDDERIEMKGSSTESHPAMNRRKAVALALEEVQDMENEVGNDNAGDELKRWEDEQIKKGSQMPTNQMPINQPDVYGPKIPVAPVSMPTSMVYNNSMGIPMMQPSNYMQYNQPQVTNCYSIPTVDQENVTVDYVCQKLSECLDTKRQMARIHKQENEKTKFDLESSQANIIHLNRKNGDISERFSFFQDIRGYIKDLLECLSEKVNRINSLEASMHQVLKKNNERITLRRQNDVKDECDEVLGKNNTDSDRITNIKSRRIAEREARRTRRREKRRLTSIVHYDGLSSDDELIPSDELRFKAEKAKLLKEASMLFEDVVEDFSSLKEIKCRFEQWKFAFNESYKQAFLGLCLPKLFTPFIKLELLNWNPLEVDNLVDFEEMLWYSTLAMFGDYGDVKVESEDDDIKLLPNIIEKVLIPKLTVLMRDVWDPMSTNQTKLAAFLFQRLVDDYPTISADSKETKALVDAIVNKLQTAVETEIYIPIYPKSCLEANNSVHLLFLQRQFWKGVKLLKNLMSWNWLLSRNKLQQLGIDAILNRYLIIALQQFPDTVSTFEKAKMVINVLPKEWFEQSDNIVPGLQSFARLLISMATNTFKSTLGYTGDIEKKKLRMTIKKIISMLMHIQAFDDAKFLANSFKEEMANNDSPLMSPTVQPTIS